MRKRKTNKTNRTQNIIALTSLVVSSIAFLYSGCFFESTAQENENVNEEPQCEPVNGFIDCDDPLCYDHEQCQSVTEICDNGIDDSGNGKTDCEDPECDDHESCSIKVGIEVCDNGIDDNGNGKTDCEDPFCFNHEACRTEVEEEICDNGIDDNGNGKTDCEDPDCEAHETCRPQNSCCLAAETPGCNDYEIESCVCAENPWCCEMKWDDVCVQMISVMECGECVSPCESDCTLPECENNEACACDSPHNAPGCGDTEIQECVCEENCYCCEAEWDEVCVEQVEALGCMD